MSKNLPRSAERKFALLCADAGVACNPAQEDVNGWDFVIEFPAIVGFTACQLGVMVWAGVI